MEIHTDFYLKRFSLHPFELCWLKGWLYVLFFIWKAFISSNVVQHEVFQLFEFSCIKNFQILIQENIFHSILSNYRNICFFEKFLKDIDKFIALSFILDPNNQPTIILEATKTPTMLEKSTPKLNFYVFNCSYKDQKKSFDKNLGGNQYLIVYIPEIRVAITPLFREFSK